ncbi:hypothetical protein [Negadavirga shengliensis]|uniref:Transcription elongation factor GreA/GreB C-terminal domain-containing protein n=1 Tax=Negadavirga shengliensis TaxID=1389218 RepID=A0ABV9T4D6_9BACT
MSRISSSTKALLSEMASGTIRKQIKDIQSQLEALQQSSEAEDKSSSGDKYETAREVINQSRNILEKQLVSYQMMNERLKMIPVHASDKVQEGALIELELGWIWVSVALGKEVLDGVEFQLVSKDSPLVAAIWGCKAGQTAVFRKGKIKVQRIH